jgi:cytochrome c oxidase cbb3-type subunit 1
MTGGFMSLSQPNAAMVQAVRAEESEVQLGTSAGSIGRRVMAAAAWHSLLWLIIANSVGVLLAAMLLIPQVNDLLGQWTYGRWMPVHLNLQLYGWCSLPLVAFLFRVYGSDREPVAVWCRPVLWVWSCALGIGALSWLNGQSSGKLFLDWIGYPRVLFPMALLTLWLVLTYSFLSGLKHGANVSGPVRILKMAGLALLLSVPFLIYVAASPAIYPPVNPDTGGPTGASQLESTLVIIAILLLLPFGISSRRAPRSWQTTSAWLIFTAECLLCLGLGRADVSHHRPTQWISLGSLLVWIPLTPAYYDAFLWHENTHRWRIAFLCWWSILVPTGWMFFLPGVLDHFKFTDGLVGHSLLAMAGFVSSLLIFVMVQLLGDDGWIFNRTWSFCVWQVSVFAYVLIMFFAGWREGSDPVFSFVPGALRNGIYALRLLLGTLILLASLDWFVECSKLFGETASESPYERQGEIQ